MVLRYTFKSERMVTSTTVVTFVRVPFYMTLALHFIYPIIRVVKIVKE